MSNRDEEKPDQRLPILSWGDDEETQVLEEPSLSELLAFRMPGIELMAEEEEKEEEEKQDSREVKFRRNSDATLEFDSEAWVAKAPISEVMGNERRHTPATLEVDVGEKQLAALRAERQAELARSKAELSQVSKPRSAAAPPEISAQETPRARTLKNDDLRPEGVEAYRHWELSETPLASILLSLVGVSEATVLDLRSGKNRAQLLISHGELLEVRLLPCSSKRSLVGGLVKKGRLNPAQAASVRQYAYQKGISEAGALLKAGNLLPATTIRAAARARGRHLLNRLMQANLAQASAYRMESVPRGLRVAPIPLVGILFQRVRSHYDSAHPSVRSKAEQRYIGMLIKRKPNFSFSINDLGLPIHERQLLDRVLTREREYDRVLHNSPTSRQATVAILVGLDAVGLLKVEPPGLSGHASSSWAEDMARAGARIDAMESRLKNESYFDLLGVHWSTYDTEVERAYRGLSAHFDLLEQPLGLDAAQRRRLEVIRGELDKIYAILSDPTRRARYRCTLVSPARSRRAARRLDGLGAAAFRKRLFHSALDYYQRLLALEPDNSSISRLLPVLLARTTSRRS